MNQFRKSFIAVTFAIGCLSLASAIDAQSVSVGSVEDLYSAANNPANAGATLVLAPGVYKLSVNDPNGNPRPNKGRLELQENMSLLGTVNDRSAVVIDAADLPLASFQTPALSGAIRIGRGTNSIEWLTVKNAVNGTANIETDLIWPGTAYVRIAHIASINSLRGLDVRNFGAAAAGAVIEADVVDNDMSGHLLRQGEGMRFGNNLGATGASVIARLSGNRSFNNVQGMLLENNRTDLARVSVTSSGDRFFENGAGTIILAGLGFLTVAANQNVIDFEARGTRFEDNNSSTPFDRGGLFIVGGENTSFPNGTNNNTVHVGLWGCRFSNNQMVDLAGIGARSNPESIGLPGVNDRVTIEIHGEGSGKGRWQQVEFFANSLPTDPNTTNSVTVIR